MGWFSKIFKAVLSPITSILGIGGSQSYRVPEMPKAPEVQARDLVPSTEASEPEAPVLGTEKKKKTRGRKDVLVRQVDGALANNSYNPTNM